MTLPTVRSLVACLLTAACFAPRAGVAAVPATAPASRPAQTQPDKGEFIRYIDDGRSGGTLDTAIATYENAAGVVVHLVAAVHVGEPSYYRGLSRTFETYDALLYELVRSREAGLPPAPALPPGHADGDRSDGSASEPNPHADTADAQPITSQPSRIDAPMRGGGTRIRGASVIGGLQGFLKDVLKLDFQLEAIDYTKPNFVHADLDAETFNELQDQRGESMLGLMFRSTLRQMKRQFEGEGAPPITAFDLIAAMRSPDSARQYKLLLARQLSDVEGQLDGLDGDGEDSTVLISERNKAALKVLDQTIASGKRNIGIFYGAGHMRGIQEVLVERMGFKRTGLEWRTAWEMREPTSDDHATTKPAKQ